MQARELHERVTRAYMQPAVTHQYRNLPRRNAQRLLLGAGFGPMDPTF